jgi:cyclopropane fatty-acyl-phospholipid synthase-like methyltransferase
MTSKSGDYWKQHILSWEAGAYFKDQGRNPPFWDRLSTLFRGDGMYVRMDAALGIIAPYLKDKTVLDLGCGTGRFAIRMLEAGAARVIGMDVSSAAIEIAERRAQGTYRDRLEFRVADLMHPETSLPPAGLITALGLIEYFDAAELDALLGRFQAPHFLLDFPDAQGRTRNWFLWNLRQVYLRFNRCPGVYLYTQDEFRRMAEAHGFHDVRFIRHSIFDYAVHLPPAP